MYALPSATILNFFMFYCQCTHFFAIVLFFKTCIIILCTFFAIILLFKNCYCQIVQYFCNNFIFLLLFLQQFNIFYFYCKCMYFLRQPFFIFKTFIAKLCTFFAIISLFLSVEHFSMSSNVS